MPNALYDQSIVVDATAPLSPFAAIQTAFEPEELLSAYSSAGITFAVFTVVDDFPNSIEQTIKLLGANRHYFLNRPEKFVLAERVDDVRRAKKKGGQAGGGLCISG